MQFSFIVFPLQFMQSIKDAKVLYKRGKRGCNIRFNAVNNGRNKVENQIAVNIIGSIAAILPKELLVKSIFSSILCISLFLF